MKISLDIPEKYDLENIYLVTRNELIAYKMACKKWHIKKIRCNKCGRCCMIHPKNGAYFPLQKNGYCIHLKPDGDKFVCSIGMEKPLACVIGEPVDDEHKKFNCSIGY